MRFTGPFRDDVWNAWWNVSICGFLIVGFMTSAIGTGDALLWSGAIGTLVMEGLFVYSLVKAYRGRARELESFMDAD